MATSLRRLTEREVGIVGEHSAKHGAVFGFNQAVADDAGNVSSPLIRLPLIARLHAHGTISAEQAAAAELFHKLFRIASLDPLKASDLARSPGGKAIGDLLPPSAERCRRQVSDAIRALGGAASPAAGAVWNVVGLEMTVRQWALSTGRRQDFANGALAAGLAILVAHFAGRRSTKRAETVSA